MELKELLDTVNDAYPHRLSAYYDEEGNFVDNEVGGDGLAKFIVIEIIETFNPQADTLEDLETAISKLKSAEEDIDETIENLTQEYIRV